MLPLNRYESPGRMRENSFPPSFSENPAGPGPRPKGRGLWAVLCILAALLIVGAILYGTLFRLKYARVQVVGLVNRTAQEVITLAGLAEGDNILLLNKEKIREGIDRDRYLIFQDMQRDYPDGLILKVYERIPRVSMQFMGVQYTLDSEGMVLEQTQTLLPEEGLMTATGMEITKSELGRQIVCRQETQLSAYQQVVGELVLQGIASQISELNLADVDNLYLISVDGYSIRLGDQVDMRAKIGSMRAVIAYLQDTGRQKGSIDVSTPVNPTYIPAD